MFISLTTIGIIALCIIRTKNVDVNSPSYIDFQFLNEHYSSTLRCPCSQLTIFYETFTRVNVKFHQVCSSKFVSATWIESIYENHNGSSSFSKTDVHSTLTNFWQTIAALCRISKSSINDALAQFNASTCLSPMATTKEVVRMETDAELDALVTSFQSIIMRDLLTIQHLTAGNQVVSSLATNFDAHLVSSGLGFELRLSPKIFGNCSCLNVHGCSRQLYFDYLINQTMIAIPGMTSNCLMVNAVLDSSLECYYNLSCINLLHASMNNIEFLKIDGKSDFMPNSTIRAILNDLMTEEIKVKVDFNNYYAQCKPTHCSYVYSHRCDVLFAITTMIGVYGGLSVFLNFIIPVIVKRSLRDRMHYLWQTLVDLNLFKSRILDAEKIPQQRITTRFFIFLMVFSTIIIGFYAFLSVQTQIITIANPSLDTYEDLYNNYSTTLSCPCSQAIVPYGSFVTIAYTLHQICSSDLVSSDWLNFILGYNQSISFNFSGMYRMNEEFQRTGSSYFQFLASFCSVAREIIDEAINTIILTQYVNSHVPSKSLFIKHITAFNRSLTLCIIDDFMRTKDWLVTAALANRYLIGLYSNERIQFLEDNSTIVVDDIILPHHDQPQEQSISILGMCSCRRSSSSCHRVPTLVYKMANGTRTWRNFIGIEVGCVPVFDLLNSDVSWWYTSAYIEQIRQGYAEGVNVKEIPNIQPLNSSVSTRFHMNNQSYILFEALLDELLIETWTNDIFRFDLFYTLCAPLSCSYTIDEKYPLFVALLLLISICGGLNRALRLFLPALINLSHFSLEKYYNRNRTKGSKTPINIQLRQFGMKIYQSLVTLNSFKARTINEIDEYYGRQYTRIYVFLLTISVVTILLYTSLTPKSKVVTIQAPINSFEFEKIYPLYSNTLQCPCKQISMLYGDFISTTEFVSYHPVCSSVFVTGDWISYLMNEGKLPDWISDHDFRHWGAVFFQTLRSLCSIATKTTDDILLDFLSSTFLISEIVLHDQLHTQTNITLRQLQRTISVIFNQALELIRITNQGNGLMNIFSSNWRFILNDIKNSSSYLTTQPVSYNNSSCSCAISSKCSSSAALFNNNLTLLHTIDGLRFGCSILESLLQSSLECFYSFTCIEQLLIAMPMGGPMYNQFYRVPIDCFVPINISGSNFVVNDTIETIVNRMLIESWSADVSYELFYSACAPQQCSFKLTYRFDPLDVMTTFLSIFAGLSLSLRFFVPRLVMLIYKIRNRSRTVPYQSK
ncbi:unnamed protein product [Rotaria sp. Silwood2]|nr:unnamed protein product [Rotaria sp. Silwood2]